MMEIYSEKVKDLFNPDSGDRINGLKVRDNPQTGPSRILAILVINHDSMGSTLDLLLEACGCDLPALLRNHFATSCARFYAIYSQNTSDNAELVSFYINAATGCLDFLKKAMTEKRFNTYYHSKLADILCALVDLVVMEPSGTKLASYALPNFLTSLSQLAKAEKTDVPHHLCSPSHDRIQTLLLYLRVRIASEFRVFRQYVEDLSRSVITSYKEFENLLGEGNAVRTVAATQMNATSSRAHTACARGRHRGAAAGGLDGSRMQHSLVLIMNTLRMRMQLLTYQLSYN